jgi:hypothetical protein
VDPWLAVTTSEAPHRRARLGRHPSEIWQVLGTAALLRFCVTRKQLKLHVNHSALCSKPIVFENRRTCKGTRGSNPFPSADFRVFSIGCRGLSGGQQGTAADTFCHEIWQTFGKRSGFPRPLSCRGATGDRKA